MSMTMPKNQTHICYSPYSVGTKSIWYAGNPLRQATPLLMFQLSIISIVSHIIDLCLRPLGQSIVVSQIFGGIVLGPSLIGQKEEVSKTLFPKRGSQMIELLGSVGLMFFLFSIGVKMNPSAMIRPERRAIAIGLSVFFFTMAFPMVLTFIILNYVPVDASIASGLPLVVVSQALTTFPVIACMLTELRLLKTEIGHLAISASMFCDLLGNAAMTFVATVLENRGRHIISAVWALLSIFALIFAVVYIIRPAILWMLSRTPHGKPVGETLIFVIFIALMVVSFLSELIGQHYTFGSMLLGLAMPEGPPLGSAVVTKVDSLVAGLLYPTYLAVSGLKTDVFTIHLQTLWIVSVITLFGALVKVGATMLPAVYSNVPVHDAFVLGLILNAKGMIEIMMYNLWNDSKDLDDELFSVCVLSVIVVTAILTPLIKYLYDPSIQYTSIKRSTIQHAKHFSGLRILVCVHKQDNVPTIINLLEVSNATEESPIDITVLILAELVGRAAPILVAHKNHQHRQIGTHGESLSDQIINAFMQYEDLNEGYAAVQLFTSISQFNIMHEDICQVAFNKRANIVIVPFHKQWAIDGSVGSTNSAYQAINLKVLEKAPCSVGILIDRGILSGSMSVSTSRTLYHVAVLFMGGPDDVESLAYAARMAKHGSVDLTVIRFLLFGSENSKDRRHDTDLINEYRRANVGNEKFVYVEEVVRDVDGLSASVKEMIDCFELIIVGRHHQSTPLLAGLENWSECPELGVIGDMLASPDFGSTASVLVVQQHRIGRGRAVLEEVNDRESFVHDVPHDSSRPMRNQNGSWSISMD